MPSRRGNARAEAADKFPSQSLSLLISANTSILGLDVSPLLYSLPELACILLDSFLI